MASLHTKESKAGFGTGSDTYNAHTIQGKLQELIANYFHQIKDAELHWFSISDPVTINDYETNG